MEGLVEAGLVVLVTLHQLFMSRSYRKSPTGATMRRREESVVARLACIEKACFTFFQVA